MKLAFSSNLNVIGLDFDGTLRDGLAEKTFTVSQTAMIAARLHGVLVDEFVSGDWKLYAGLPLGQIVSSKWHSTVQKAAATGGDFIKTCEQVHVDIYSLLDAQRSPDPAIRQAKMSGIKTPFTPYERRHLIEKMPSAPWFAGIEALTGTLHRAGDYLGVLSNTPDVESLTKEVNAGGFGGDFNSIHTGSPIKEGKPDARSLLHIVARAIGDRLDPPASARLLEAFARRDAAQHDLTMDNLLQLSHEKKLAVDVLMIGDGLPDMTTAANAKRILAEAGLENIKVSTVAVTYGFMPEETLASTHPTFIVRTPEALADVVYRWKAQNISGPPLG